MKDHTYERMITVLGGVPRWVGNRVWSVVYWSCYAIFHPFRRGIAALRGAWEDAGYG